MDSTTETLDPSTFNNVLNGSGGGLIPESLIATMTIGFILINVLGLLFFVAYVATAIRNWKVQSAVFHIQKDLAELKDALNTSRPAEGPKAPAQASSEAETTASPTDSNKTVASHDQSSEVS